MERFAFVILNYLTLDETLKCVDSIKKCCKNQQYHIYIVDNASPDNSGEKIKQLFQADDNVDVTISDENIGFAKGNNIGFKKAKYEFKADYIILCNSDTIILSDDFCEKIIKRYKNDSFAVMGPKEILPDGSNYPLNNKFPTIESTKKNIKNLKRKLLANNNNIYAIFYNLNNKIKKTIKKIIKKNNNYSNNSLDYDKEYNDIILHGFFLIFSIDYIKKFDGLDDRTYFYGEEDLLALRIKKEGLISIYYPEIKVLHNKNSATNARTKNSKEKNRFIYENQIKSFYILLNDLMNNN